MCIILWFQLVFSAYAEVVPSHAPMSYRRFRILRVRGGSSVVAVTIVFFLSYSPRTRR